MYDSAPIFGGNLVTNRNTVFHFVPKNTFGTFRLKITFYLEKNAYICTHTPLRGFIYFNTVSLFSGFEVNIFQYLGDKKKFDRVTFDVLFENFSPLHVLARICQSFISLCNQ